MKVLYSLLFLVAASLVTSAPHRGKGSGQQGPGQSGGFQNTTTPDVATLDSLLPQFGVVAGTNKDKNQNCQGINQAGKIVAIQCQCPPDRTAFLKKLSSALKAGKVSVPDGSGQVHEFKITFSTTASSNDTVANRARATAALTVLQNFDGKFGKGCPAVSVPNFQSMQNNGVRVDRQLVPPQ